MRKERLFWIAFCFFVFLGCEFRVRILKKNQNSFSIPASQQDDYKDIFENEVSLNMRNYATSLDDNSEKEEDINVSYDAGVEAEENEQDPYMRGYITGYHKALEQQTCPR